VAGPIAPPLAVKAAMMEFDAGTGTLPLSPSMGA